MSEHDAGEQRCSGVLCGKPSVYRIRAISDVTGEVINAYRCTACAAAIHYQKGLPFPPGMWDRSDGLEIPEHTVTPAPPDQVAAEPPAIATLPVHPEVVRPRKRIVFEIPETGALTGFCESCRAAIYWIPSAKGTPMPIEALGEHRGESHFAHCPHANYHRKARA